MNDHSPIHSGFNLSLGAMRREYIPLFVKKGANDPKIMSGVILQPPITLESELEWYDNRVSTGDDIVFAILLHKRRETGLATRYRFIGHTGLYKIEWPGGHANSGSIIIDKSIFGKGYGTEAKMLLLYEAFRNQGLRKVCAHVKAFNGNSWGHLLACGYQQVGRRKCHHFHDGKFVDDVELEVFREEWEPIWHTYQKTKTPPRLKNKQREYLRKEVRAS